MKIFKKMNNNAVFANVYTKYLRVAGIALCFHVSPLFAEEKVVTNPIPNVQVLQLKAEQWELARSGETVLALPVLNQVINAWLREKDKSIEIQYPGGEEGEFWVQSLTDWLVSLGVPSDHLVTVPGSGLDDVIKFVLIK